MNSLSFTSQAIMAETAERKQTRIFLWSWPKSISTAVEKCLSFVDGVQTWHEPYTVAHLKSLMEGASADGEDSAIANVMKEYMQMMDNIGKTSNEFSNSRFMPVALFKYPFVKSELEKEEPGKQYIIIKDMAAAILDHFDELPNVPTRHTFIIRHPYRFLLSSRRMMLRMINFEGDQTKFDMFEASPHMLQSYYTSDAMYQTWKSVQETGKETKPIIIDAEDIMSHPDKIIPKYLEALGIPFYEKYLKWDSSEDILQTWKGALEQVLVGKMTGTFDKAFKSSCFLPLDHPMPKREDLTPDILKVADILLPGYEEMYQHRIKPE